MRGKAQSPKMRIIHNRITPAYAGKRNAHRAEKSTARDHPRLCGEKCLMVFLLLLMLGSPPPMRGKVFNLSDLRSGDRITPAYAGKSPRCRFLLFGSEDHPRLCGEKPAERGLLCLKQGSPPPMRGKVLYHACKLHFFRITPAYAGKSFSLLRCYFLPWDHPRLCGEKFC